MDSIKYEKMKELNEKTDNVLRTLQTKFPHNYFNVEQTEEKLTDAMQEITNVMNAQARMIGEIKEPQRKALVEKSVKLIQERARFWITALSI